MTGEEGLFNQINIARGDFTNKYEDANILPCLESFQNLYNLVYPEKLIQGISIFDIAGPKEEIINKIRDNLPKNNYKSIFAINTGDHWTAMVIHNLPEGIRVQFNDSAGCAMPEVLSEALKDLEIDRNLTDYHSKMGPGGNNCGRNIFVNLYQMVENPDADRLYAPDIQDPDHNKICRISHVLFSSNYFSEIYNPEEARILLDVFSKLHAMVSLEELEGYFKTLCFYLSEKDQELHKDCAEAISHVTFKDFSGKADEICFAQLEKLTEISQSFTIQNTSTCHEDSGGGTEEPKKEDLKPILIKKYNLGEGYEMQLYQDGKTSLTLNGERCKFIEEKVAEQIKGQVYENPHTHEKAGVLWMDGEPELVDDIETLGLIVVGHDNEV